MSTSKIIVALDYEEEVAMWSLVDQLDPQLCQLKIGSILFTRYGPRLVEQLMAKQFKVFLDLKYHDIPHTVAQACMAAAKLGVWMLTLHVQGGLRMLLAASEALDKIPAAQRPLLLGVTVLTSFEQQDFALLGEHAKLSDRVVQLANLAVQGGLQGVVCSAEELTLLSDLPKNFLRVTPGIRLENDDLSDQRRVATPNQALALGADYLVIGRSITKADEPKKILEALHILKR